MIRIVRFVGDFADFGGAKFGQGLGGSDGVLLNLRALQA